MTSQDKSIPILSDFEVYEQIRKSKKPKSSVPGDLPRRLVKEFGPELAAPVAKIYRNIVKSGHWPKSWRIEYGTPLRKQPNPETEDHLRIISLTNYLSKTFERFVIDWLMVFIGDQLDWGQYGGQKGSSIAHYLIDLINFIRYNQDLRIPHAVVAVLIDFSKAFNRIHHNIVIAILSEMGVPGWLLKIVIGFLTDRELLVRYKGRTSNRKYLPGGGPQGTLLGLFLFLILINAAGCGHLQEHVGSHITTNLNKRVPMKRMHMKYIDDMSEAFAINLKNCVVPNPDPNPPRPLAYHDRTGHVLPEGSDCPVQSELDKLVQYCNESDMKINTSKTKVMMFSNSRNYDYMPKLHIQSGINLEVVEQQKLLGIVIQSDLRWYANTNNMCGKGYSRLWMLRRLKLVGANEDELLDVYEKQVRSIMELAVAVWEPGLSVAEDKQIERVQKAALSIILGENYESYGNALRTLDVETLSSRRKKLTLTFAKKAYKHPKYQTWFRNSTGNVPNTRAEKTVLKTVQTRTNKYRDSPLPYLTSVLNKHFGDKQNQ